MVKRIGLFVALVSMVAGCGSSPGGYSAKAPDANRPAEAQGPMADFAAKSSSPGAGYAAAEPAPASAPVMRDSASESPQPQKRPGLGTEWGEARRSEVRDVTFVRSDAHRPFAVATLNYDDRAGVEAMVAFKERRGPSFRETSAANGLVSVSIRDGSGDPLEAMRLGERTFVIGQAGERYTIVLQNRSDHRFEAVGTVDGLDVVNGQPGTLDNRGYVLNPHATLEIEGFRQSASHVATFRFGRVSDSYAAQTGSARNVGVIGVAFFSERGDSFVNDRELRLRESANPFPAADPRFAPPPPGR
jgi:hypothetical protein